MKTISRTELADFKYISSHDSQEIAKYNWEICIVTKEDGNMIGTTVGCDGKEYGDKKYSRVAVDRVCKVHRDLSIGEFYDGGIVD
jgi:hypothetical protein